MTSVTPTTAGKRPYEASVWRVRTLIRVGAVTQALGWIALVLVLGVRGDETLFSWAALVGFVVVVPFLALWPRIRLRADGSVTFWGWTRVLTANVDEIVRLSMSPYGLRCEFADGSTFTSVIFQATGHIRYPRVFDFVEAATGERPVLESWRVWDAATDHGIQLFPPVTAGNAATTTFFAGATPRNPDEARFLTRLAEFARGWRGPIAPSDTQSIELVPLVIGIRVLDLSTPLTLWLAYHPAEHSLIGCWGDDYVLDDYDPSDAEQLTITGENESAEFFAERASEWISHQLARPVSREWWGGKQSRWVFDDSGSTFWGYVSRRRLARGAPTRRVVERFE
ncbi:hypothetical protein [Agromyces badenianii]|uniref:hypothetical protein n=1 Tax=Agromyces badenianii TaxID=2080742 RepID=UPI000D592511|nr:hypothetical protein [Agromyces badenianii]PWC04213.1 hypothetical protein DCE94_08640 [Agromyces badenianii]